MSEINKLNNFLSSIEEIVDEARNGRMYVLVDNEDRENEGDLIIPAQMATPDAINFMATYGRGLICLSMTKNRIEELELTPMKKRNTGKLDTAFTVSIESAKDVTTGISAADRAKTIQVAIDKSSFSVNVISHTFNNTTLGQLNEKDLVNIEVDTIARYAVNATKYYVKEK